jgi:hypothetical protein
VGIAGIAPPAAGCRASCSTRTSSGRCARMGSGRTCPCPGCTNLGRAGWAGSGSSARRANVGRAARAASSRPSASASDRRATTSASGRRAAATAGRCAAAVLGVACRRRAFGRAAGAVLESTRGTLMGRSAAGRVCATSGRLGSAVCAGSADLTARAIME